MLLCHFGTQEKSEECSNKYLKFCKIVQIWSFNMTKAYNTC